MRFCTILISRRDRTSRSGYWSSRSPEMQNKQFRWKRRTNNWFRIVVRKTSLGQSLKKRPGWNQRLMKEPRLTPCSNRKGLPLPCPRSWPPKLPSKRMRPPPPRKVSCKLSHPHQTEWDHGPCSQPWPKPQPKKKNPIWSIRLRPPNASDVPRPPVQTRFRKAALFQTTWLWNRHPVWKRISKQRALTKKRRPWSNFRLQSPFPGLMPPFSLQRPWV